MKIPARPPTVDLDAFGSASQLVEALGHVNVASDPYLPWDRMRFHTPPSGLTLQQWWVATELQRRSQRRPLNLEDSAGGDFGYVLPDSLLKLVNEVSHKAGGNIGLAEPVTNPATRDTYVVRSLMEESITSSQLEGAATTRRVAKEMLRTGRSPRDKGEQMIWNNYQAMQFIREHRGDSLTPALVRELHSIVTFRTLEDPRDAGRVQEPQDERVHVGTDEGDVLHSPPSADQLATRLQALCDFANSAEGEGLWLPPILRALAVHFMVGFDHYFVDGNGRLARALFYWSMLRQGFWLTEFITISSILKGAPTKYAHSFLNTEYESDLTYFFLYHLEVLSRAFDDLELYLNEKVKERADVRRLLRGRHQDFNHRQLAVIELALADPLAQFTVVSHANSHHVTTETARKDLQELAANGILVRGKRGHAFVWRPAADARQALER